ncbi:MAG: hypothetical protein OES32_02940 [Acidobacteriota bacterium]|nr:hypothetical protein [Acidobacteriota bacterium]MDH3522519.1 hypothetical protein [Acidobacteriota bacterium]
MKRIVFVAMAAVLAAGGAAVQADSLVEDDGCDVMRFVELISFEPTPIGFKGSWLVESAFTGDTYTYSYEHADLPAVYGPTGLTADITAYVSWELEETSAKGTNRTVVSWNFEPSPWTFTFNGEIIRGARFPKGGIGGNGTYDPVAGEVAWDEVTLVFCQSHK